MPSDVYEFIGEDIFDKPDVVFFAYWPRTSATCQRVIWHCLQSRDNMKVKDVLFKK